MTCDHFVSGFNYFWVKSEQHSEPSSRSKVPRHWSEFNYVLWCHLEISSTGALFLVYRVEKLHIICYRSVWLVFFVCLCMLNNGAHWGLRASVRVCVHTCFLEEICNSLSPWRAHMTWMKLNWQPFSPQTPEVHAGRLAILLTLTVADLPQGQSSLTKLPYIGNSFSLYCTFIWHHMILNSVLFKSCSVRREGRMHERLCTFLFSKTTVNDVGLKSESSLWITGIHFLNTSSVAFVLVLV